MILVSIEGTRDVVIIAAGTLAVLAFFVMFVAAVVLGLAAKALLGAVQTLVKDDVTPLVKSAQGTVQRVQGTATFVSETTVSPIIRVYGVFAGTRRAIGVLSGVAGRRRRNGRTPDPGDERHG
jgi:hypothetical protein